MQAKGLGYAMSTAEELKFVKEVATATGVVLDPVYRYAKSLVCCYFGHSLYLCKFVRCAHTFAFLFLAFCF